MLDLIDSTPINSKQVTLFRHMLDDANTTNDEGF